MFVRLFVCLFVCLPVCLFACLPGCLPACFLLACWLACLLAGWLACLFACLSTEIGSLHALVWTVHAVAPYRQPERAQNPCIRQNGGKRSRQRKVLDVTWFGSWNLQCLVWIRYALLHSFRNQNLVCRIRNCLTEASPRAITQRLRVELLPKGDIRAMLERHNPDVEERRCGAVKYLTHFARLVLGTPCLV